MLVSLLTRSVLFLHHKTNCFADLPKSFCNGFVTFQKSIFFSFFPLYFLPSFIYSYTLLVCQFVSINVKTPEAIGPKFFFGTSHGPRENLWRLKNTKICVQMFLCFVKFQKSIVFSFFP